MGDRKEPTAVRTQQRGLQLLGNLPKLSKAVLIDLLSIVTEVPPRGLPWLPRTGRAWRATDSRTPAHIAEYGPRIHEIDPGTGRMSIVFRLYLPRAPSMR